jgi:hypothetical protein
MMSLDMPATISGTRQDVRVPMDMHPWEYYSAVSRLDATRFAAERTAAETDLSKNDSCAHRFRLALILSARPSSTRDLARAQNLLSDLPKGWFAPACDSDSLRLVGELVEAQAKLSSTADKTRAELDALRQQADQQRRQIDDEKRRADLLSGQLGRLKAIEQNIDERGPIRSPTPRTTRPDAQAKDPARR